MAKAATTGTNGIVGAGTAVVATIGTVVQAVAIGMTDRVTGMGAQVTVIGLTAMADQEIETVAPVDVLVIVMVVPVMDADRAIATSSMI
jgi:hypothetical protein